MVDAVDLMVIAAHPDDAELAVGGTLLIAKRRGWRTAVVDLTRGELSTRGDLETRERESARASELLELDERRQLDLGDGRVRDSDSARELLVGIIRELRPTVLLAPYRDDLHPDHAGAGELTWRSWYPSGIRKFVAGAEPHRPSVLGYYMCHSSFVPSVVVDVSSVWEERMAAARAYASQFASDAGPAPNTKISSPHFMDAVQGRAREYGLLAGAEYGEPLLWQQVPLLKDPVGFLGVDRSE